MLEHLDLDDEPPFHCPGCEANTGTGRLCADCEHDESEERVNAAP